MTPNSLLVSFDQFILESTDDDQSYQAAVDLLRSSLDLKLISRSEYRDQVRKISKGRDPLSIADADMIAALESPEAKKLLDTGLTLVSSHTQMLNGNLVFARPGFHRSKDCSISLFVKNRIIGRNQPPKWYGKPHTGIIKRMSESLSDLAFYRLSMRWIVDHVDLNSDCFAVKRRTRKNYFDTQLD